MVTVNAIAKELANEVTTSMSSTKLLLLTLLAYMSATML